MDGHKVKTEAFILKKKSLLHRDIVVTMVSQDFGKMIGIDKRSGGARNATRHRRAPIIGDKKPEDSTVPREALDKADSRDQKSGQEHHEHEGAEKTLFQLAPAGARKRCAGQL